MKINSLAVATAALLLSSAAFAEVYRYRDANGNIVYTDQPRREAEKVVIQPDSRPVPAPPDEQEVAKRRERCEDYRSKLADYKKAVRLVETLPDGTKHEYSKAEKQRLLADTQVRIDDACA